MSFFPASLRLRSSILQLAFTLACVAVLTACPPEEPEGITGGGGQVIPGTRWTNTTSLNTPTANPLKDVDVRCCLTLNDDATLTETCNFTNTSGQDLRFIYCDMIDLVAGKRSPNSAPPESPECNLVQNGTVVECEDRTSNGATESSYHFGCKLVEVAANGSRSITIHSDTTYVPWSSFDVRASDFVVNYSDVWNLTGSGLTFDQASCDKVNGQGGWLVPMGPYPDVAIWAVSQLPFDDPYVQHQTADGELTGEPIYIPFDAGTCVPSELRVPTEDLQVCEPSTGPVPATEVDLHLFWWRSHMGDEATPAVIELETEGVPETVRIETEPAPGEPFTMEPGEEKMGTLRLCATEAGDRCLAPELPEGESATVRAVFLHAETGEELFHQEVQFIEDTRPPRLESLRAEPGQEGLALTVEVTDEVSGVAHVHAVYSIDGGQTWERRSLETEADLMVAEGLRQAKFTGTLPLTAEAMEEETTAWYLVVQDGVYNLTYVSSP